MSAHADHKADPALKINTEKTGGMYYEGLKETKEIKIEKAGTEYHGPAVVDKIDYTKSGDTPYQYQTKQTVIEKAGSQYQGPAVVDKIDYSKSGDTPYQYQTKQTAIEKAGTAFSGQRVEKKVDTTRSGDQPLDNFPTISTAVPKKGTPWVPKNQRPVVDPIDATKSGGMQYEGVKK